MDGISSDQFFGNTARTLRVPAWPRSFDHSSEFAPVLDFFVKTCFRHRVKTDQLDCGDQTHLALHPPSGLTKTQNKLIYFDP